MLTPLGDLADGAAFAAGFVDGSAGASAQSTQRHALRAISIADGTATATAGAFGDSAVFTDPSIGTQRSALEPRLVIKLSGLHVKADGDEAALADGVG
jgi:hypothetical protein